MEQTEQEKKHKRVALISTIGINALVLLFLLLVVAWRAPNPPLPEYGIELNFGMDDQGSGAQQPQETVGTPDAQQEEAESEEAPTEADEIVPEAAAEPVEESTPAPAEQQVVSPVESPVVVKEEKKEPAKPAEKVVEKPVEKKTEAPKETKPKEDPKPLAVYKPGAAKTESSSERAGVPGSQGDDSKAAGDKGSPEGKLDAKALYGKAGGGGGGSTLDLAGWEWDSRPAPKVPDSELGGIVKFEIKVDANGEIISIRTLERSVSAETEQVCRNAVQRLTFSKTGANVPNESVGTITFVVRSK